MSREDEQMITNGTQIDQDCTKDDAVSLIERVDQQIENYQLDEQQLIEQHIQLYRQTRCTSAKSKKKKTTTPPKKTIKQVTFADDVKSGNSTDQKTQEEDDQKKKQAEKQRKEDERRRKQEVIRRKRDDLRNRKERILANKKKVFDIVVSLLAKEVSPEQFLEQVAILCKSDYEDVIVERSITKVCGYALCSNDLSEQRQRSQKFKIVLQSQQVFDISERKMFCSNVCFARSQNVKEQLHEQPLWMRQDDPKTASSTARPGQSTAKVITLYDGDKGAHGTEVELGLSRVRQIAEELGELGDECKFYQDANKERTTNAFKRVKTKDSEVESSSGLKEKQIKPGNFNYIRPEDLVKLQKSMEKLTVKERASPLSTRIVEKTSDRSG
jgi:hypothetical protein